MMLVIFKVNTFIVYQGQPTERQQKTDAGKLVQNAYHNRLQHPPLDHAHAKNGAERELDTRTF